MWSKALIQRLVIRSEMRANVCVEIELAFPVVSHALILCILLMYRCGQFVTTPLIFLKEQTPI